MRVAEYQLLDIGVKKLIYHEYHSAYKKFWFQRNFW
jgi:hypothetical protein